MAVVTVCDRCGKTLPEGSDQSSVVSTSDQRYDLCPECLLGLKSYLAGQPLVGEAREIPAQ